MSSLGNFRQIWHRRGLKGTDFLQKGTAQLQPRSHGSWSNLLGSAAADGAARRYMLWPDRYQPAKRQLLPALVHVQPVSWGRGSKDWQELQDGGGCNSKVQLGRGVVRGNCWCSGNTLFRTLDVNYHKLNNGVIVKPNEMLMFHLEWQH